MYRQELRAKTFNVEKRAFDNNTSCRMPGGSDQLQRKASKEKGKINKTPQFLKVQ